MAFWSIGCAKLADGHTSQTAKTTKNANRAAREVVGIIGNYFSCDPRVAVTAYADRCAGNYCPRRIEHAPLQRRARLGAKRGCDKQRENEGQCYGRHATFLTDLQVPAASEPKHKRLSSDRRGRRHHPGADPEGGSVWHQPCPYNDFCVKSVHDIIVLAQKLRANTLVCASTKTSHVSGKGLRHA
jgi:hypothetical protein